MSLSRGYALNENVPGERFSKKRSGKKIRILGEETKSEEVERTLLALFRFTLYLAADKQ